MSHWSQGNLFFIVSGKWHRLWIYKALCCLNAFPQVWHTWGRSSLWIALWESNTFLCTNDFPQSSQLSIYIHIHIHTYTYIHAYTCVRARIYYVWKCIIKMLYKIISNSSLSVKKLYLPELCLIFMSFDMRKKTIIFIINFTA